MPNDIKVRLDLLNTQMAVVKQTIVDNRSGEIYISWKDSKMFIKFTKALDLEAIITEGLTNGQNRT